VDAIWGIRKDGKTEIQSVRFNVKDWSESKAREWLQGNGFIVSGFEKGGEGSGILGHTTPKPGKPFGTTRSGKPVNAPDYTPMSSSTRNLGTDADMRNAARHADSQGYTTAEEHAEAAAEHKKASLRAKKAGDMRAAVAHIQVAAIHSVRARDPSSTFFVTPTEAVKGEPAPPQSPTMEVVKVEPDRRLVFGWLYVAKRKDGTQVVDHSGEVVAPGDLEKASYAYSLNSRVAGDMHSRIGVGRLVSSVVFTPDIQKAMGLPPGTVPQGWWAGFYVDDDATWMRIKDGTLKMFSIGGTATKVLADAAALEA
jgi:hypothetical protein